MSTSVTINGAEMPVKDAAAAISLCAMGGPLVIEHKNNIKANTSSPLHNKQEPADITPPPSTCSSDNESQSDDNSSTGSSPSIVPVHDLITVKAVTPAPKKRNTSTTTTEITKSNKAGGGGREARVSYEEMKRLMRVYGPTKCLRNRTPKESGKSTKILSIKRKFYRWFPDFHNRFVLQEGGWYKPRIGHEEEMKVRGELRRKDQEILAAKRNAKKNASKNKLQQRQQSVGPLEQHLMSITS